MLQRKIIHIDMDAFYASVEQLDNPELKGKPIAVGGNAKRGVVAAASYEARKFGVRSAMSSMIAAKRCPHLIFIKPRFERYREVSQKIRKIFKEYTDLVEPLSLDEAYLDVTQNKKGNPSATLVAKEIRQKILEQTGLTASAGISVNKFLAKIASDYNKPNGQKTVVQEEVQAFLDDLDVRKFHGIGKVTATKMYELGIFKGKDLRNQPLEFLEIHFKNSGKHYYNISRGIHNSPVNPNRLPKSVGAENTFGENITSLDEMKLKLDVILDKVIARMTKKEVKGKTITLKIKYEDFTLQTRSYTLNYYTANKEIIQNIVNDLLHQETLLLPVRLLGISVSNLDIYAELKYIQLELDFPEHD